MSRSRSQGTEVTTVTGAFSERTHLKPAQKAAVTWNVKTKLSSLSCLIALKLSITHKLMLKPHTSNKNCRLCL